ncbi:MAG: NAD(P)-dependent alcohol dehydrogenase [Chloroflexota bacterium]|nr:MAG: NAD(P)-dependent alcohol dehydrogenase [Chloroflexota bacterium]
MKAIVYTEYGPPEVLRLQEVEKPAPKENEVLIRIHATSVNFGDIAARNFGNISHKEFFMPLPFYLIGKLQFGISKPKNPILGNEFAGEIELVGKDVTSFKPGDQVFGYPGPQMRCNAQYRCLPEDGPLGLKPTNMSYEEAAVVPYSALMAIDLLRKVGIQRGQRVLINGASGGIGSGVLQLAKHYGAEVTGVCGTPRIEFVKSLGADKVIDYTKEDFTKNGETYDLIVDVLGKSSFSQCEDSLKEAGKYVMTSFKMRDILDMLRTSFGSGKKAICAILNEKTEDLVLTKELAEAGKLKAIIDNSFTLEQTADAHRYMESGQRKGNIVITVDKMA